MKTFLCICRTAIIKTAINLTFFEKKAKKSLNAETYINLRFYADNTDCTFGTLQLQICATHNYCTN